MSESKQPVDVTQDQVGCARCYADGHPGITYRPLTFPIRLADGWKGTHWAPCPTNGEPIIYAVKVEHDFDGLAE
jgi:hypothetical protein